MTAATVVIVKPITGAVTVALVLILTACSDINSTADDQAFIQMTAADDHLSAVDVSTRIQLGHEMCGLLKKHHGDAAAAEAEMAVGQTVFTPSMMSALSTDAAVAYCPKYR